MAKLTKRTGFFGGTYLEDQHGNCVDFEDDTRGDGGSLAGDLIGGVFGLAWGATVLTAQATGHILNGTVCATGHLLNGGYQLGKWTVNQTQDEMARRRGEVPFSDLSDLEKGLQMVKWFASKKDLNMFLWTETSVDEQNELLEEFGFDPMENDWDDLSKDELLTITIQVLTSTLDEWDVSEIMEYIDEMFPSIDRNINE